MKFDVGDPVMMEHGPNWGARQRTPAVIVRFTRTRVRIAMLSPEGEVSERFAFSRQLEPRTESAEIDAVLARRNRTVPTGRST